MPVSLLLAAALAACPAQGTRVTCVHDGDTLWLAGEKVRLAGIDAPELAGRCPAETALAIRARNRLIALLSTGEPSLVRHGSDRYGRTLADVGVDGRDAGEALVAEGLARRWTGRREPWC